MSEIQSLTLRVRALSESADFWNNVMLWSLAFAALAAVAIGISSWMAVSRSKQLSTAQDLLTDAKEREKEVKIAELGRQTAEANKATEDERLARVKLEAGVAWRHLTEKQKAEIGANLGNFANQEGASLWYEAGDTEAGAFASDIAEALKAAHIVVQPPANIVKMIGAGHFGDPIKAVETGVILQSTKDERSRSLADAVIKELNVRGFNATRQTDPPFDDKPVPQVWVNVEPRPEGPQGEYKLQAIEDIRNKRKATN